MKKPQRLRLSFAPIVGNRPSLHFFGVVPSSPVRGGRLIRFRRQAALWCAAAGAIGATEASAAPKAYTGASSNLWSNALNWSPTGVPVNGDTVTIGSGLAANYVLTFDWRYQRPEKLEDDKKFNGNSGLLLHIQEPHKVWPTSLEVQGANSSHGSFIGINTKVAHYKFDSAALAKVRNKVGEWNTTEVAVKDGAVVAKVNGTVVGTGTITLKDGPLGFQSEGAEIHFKNIRIKKND